MASQTNAASIPTASSVSSLDDPSEGFDDLCRAVRESFDLAARGPLFTTKPLTPLSEIFRANLPEDRRQHYDCRSCAHFFERYAGLVSISADGMQTPAAWDFDDEKFTPPFFLAAVQAVREYVRQSTVNGVFLSKEKILGTPRNEDKKRNVTWSHLSVVQPKPFHSFVKAAHEIAAERREDFILVGKILDEYPLATFQEALKLLKGGNLARPDAHAAMAEWYIGLHLKTGIKGRTARNITWHAVATAPAGYTHIRAGVLGTLLDDVKAGLPFDTIERRWREKMGPLAYRRTQADPSAGNVEQAEKLVAKLGIAASLRRRFAKIEDILPHALWKPYVDPNPAQPAQGSVFGHLRTKDSQPQRPIEQPPTVITWEKFARTVLPDAKFIEARVPSQGNYVALITAVDPAAPPILQWDSAERRNPVSWYLRHPIGSAVQWNLRGSTYVPVTAISYTPPMWGQEDKPTHHGRAVDFLLQGCRDLEVGGGGGLFTQSLRSELHSVRSVLEAHFKDYAVEGREEASACGLRLQEHATTPVTLRVVTMMGTMTYTIDRWD